ncbi:hypothetical protein KY360_00155 [Candidatus Woesearchaeota archaeon]|nr:hypothetical protein [Candidatus Woesearchaeota archaeon]
MGCNNCYNVSYHPCNSNYAFSGDCNVVAEYFLNSDLPAYTARFYSPTPQEVFSDFRYDRVGLDYSGSKEMVEAARGLDVDIPRGSVVIEGGGAPSSRALIPLPKNEVADEVQKEIRKAQEEVAGKELVLRELQVDELILRRIRKREIVIKDSKDKKSRKIIDQ